MSHSEVVEVVQTELEEVIQNEALEASTRNDLMTNFFPFWQQFDAMREKAASLVVTSPEDKAIMREADETRLVLKKIRTTVEKRRKELKADSLAKGRAIDSVAKLITEKIEPLEEHCRQQAEWIVIYEAKRKEELTAARSQELSPYARVELYDLGNMEEEEFQEILSAAKDAHTLRLQREEEARLAEERRKAEAEAERQRLLEEAKKNREENEQLAAELKKQKEAEAKALKEAEEEKKRLAAKVEAERRAAEAERQRIIQEAEAEKLMAAAEARKAEEVRRKTEEALAKAEAERERLLSEKLVKEEVIKNQGEAAMFLDIADTLDRMTGLYAPEKYKAFWEIVRGLLSKTSKYIRDNVGKIQA